MCSGHDGMRPTDVGKELPFDAKVHLYITPEIEGEPVFPFHLCNGSIGWETAASESVFTTVRLNANYITSGSMIGGQSKRLSLTIDHSPSELIVHVRRDPSTPRVPCVL